MNEAHGQNYDAEQYLGAIDEEEIRVMVHDGLRSLRRLAVALEHIEQDFSAIVGGTEKGPALRVMGELEMIGGAGDVQELA